MEEKILILVDEKYVISRPSHSLFHAVYNIVSKASMNIIYTLKVIPLVKKLKDDKTKKIVVIGLDAKTQQRLRKKKIEYKIPDDYLTNELYRLIDEEAMTFVRGLPNFEKSGRFKSSCIHQDIFLWELMEVEVWGFFVDILKAIHIVERSIDTEKPDKIIVIDDDGLYGNVLKTKSLEKVQVLSIQPKIISSLKCRFVNWSMPYIFRYMRQWRRLKPAAIKNLGHINSKAIKNKILVGYFGRFSYMITAYAKELKKNDKNEIIVLGKSSIMGSSVPTITPRDKDKFEKEDITFKAFEGYMTQKIYEKVDEEVRSLEKKWNYLKRDHTFKNSVTYKDFELWDLAKYKFLFLFFVRFPKLIEEIEIMKYVIDIEKADIIITENDRSPFAKMLLEVGNLADLPTLIVEHAMITDHPIYGHSSADKIAVMGEYMKRVRIKKGVNPNRIVITGQPRYDILTQKNRFRKEDICKQLKIDPDKRIILFAATHSSEEGSELLIRGIYEAAERYPETVLVVKPHPGDSDNLYREIANEMNVNTVITFDYLYELLHACDILITTHSAVGLEAMIVDKPVITINLTNKPDPYPYAESGAAIGVYKSEGIPLAIKKALYDPQAKKALEVNRKKFVYEHAYKMDGLASRRVADLIEKMIEEQ